MLHLDFRNLREKEKEKSKYKEKNVKTIKKKNQIKINYFLVGDFIIYLISNKVFLSLI